MSRSDLGEAFRRLIRNTGPLSVSRYMGESNAHYYAAGDPLGVGGDFVTAPEISQMFGEMIGLWCADLWHRAGRPDRVRYVELGPGRGTLAKDVLRAMKQQGLEPDAHFVEGSPALRGIQSGAVPGAAHHDDLTNVPDGGPLFILANEFFDALPIRQVVRTARGWRERMVGLNDDGAFVFIAGDQPLDEALAPEKREADEGTIIETCPAASALMQEISARLKAQGGAALIIDYGAFESWAGSTLQAVRAHRKVDPLEAPGSADLTAHVDFAALAEATERAGVEQVFRSTQGAFLERLGITARANALAKAQPDRREQVAKEHRRLCAPDEMGDLFKVMALVSGGWPIPTGFD